MRAIHNIRAEHPYYHVQGLTKDNVLTPERAAQLNPDKVDLYDKIYKGEKLNEEELSRLHCRDIASDTYKRPIGTQEISAVIHEIMAGRIGEGRVLTFRISPKDLATLHPGSVSVKNSDHLHPYKPGNSTSHQYADQEILTVAWRYPKPKPGQIHPEPVQLTDGSLTAVWLSKEEPKELMKKFIDHQANMLDYLHGNKNAMHPNRIKRAYHHTIYRFKSYFRGMHEGMGNPRFNGSIGANLVLTSLPISALLYCFIYSIDYHETKHKMHKKQKHFADDNKGNFNSNSYGYGNGNGNGYASNMPLNANPTVAVMT